MGGSNYKGLRYFPIWQLKFITAGYQDATVNLNIFFVVVVQQCTECKLHSFYYSCREYFNYFPKNLLKISV